MLVLNRSKDESVVIGEIVTVKILEICGSKVRLGFEAPKEMSIHRGEIHELILEERKRDAQEKAEAAQAQEEARQQTTETETEGE